MFVRGVREQFIDVGEDNVIPEEDQEMDVQRWEIAPVFKTCQREKKNQ